MNDIKKIFTNGAFIDMGPGSYAAVGVNGKGIITRLFRAHEELQSSIPAGVPVIDMHNLWAIPAFEDAHNHLAARARTLFEIDLRGQDISWDAAKERIAERARKTPDGGWVVCHGWNEARWGIIGQAELDEMSFTKGIFLINVSYHGGLVNMKGISLLAEKGCVIGKTGRVTEGEFESVTIATSPDMEGYVKAIPQLQERLLSLGVGAVHDMHILTLEQLAVYRRLDARGLLKLPTVLYINPRLLGFKKEIADYIHASGGMARLAGLKLFLDGAIGTSTASVHGGYADHTGTGILRHTQEECVEYVQQAVEIGLEQVSMHCIGDKAVDQAVAIFTALRREYAGKIKVWRFEHFEMPSDAAIQAVAAHGGIASMQPNFSWDAENYRTRLGARVATINPLRKVLDAGAVLAFGSDDVPSGPIEGIRWAATKAPYEMQRLTIPEALRAYTEAPAIAAGSPERRGKMAVGYEANFTVLDRDPLQKESWTDEANGIAVKEVWLRGEKRFG